MEFLTKFVGLASLISGLLAEDVQVGRKTEGLIAPMTPMKLGTGVHWTEGAGSFTRFHTGGFVPSSTQKCFKDKTQNAITCITISEYGFSFGDEEVFKTGTGKCAAGSVCVKSIRGDLQVLATGEAPTFGWETSFFSMFPKRAMREAFKKDITFDAASAKSIWYRQLSYHAIGHMNITTPKNTYYANIQGFLPIKTESGAVDGIYGAE